MAFSRQRAGNITTKFLGHYWTTPHCFLHYRCKGIINQLRDLHMYSSCSTFNSIIYYLSYIHTEHILAKTVASSLSIYTVTKKNESPLSSTQKWIMLLVTFFDDSHWLYKIWIPLCLYLSLRQQAWICDFRATLKTNYDTVWKVVIKVL